MHDAVIEFQKRLHRHKTKKNPFNLRNWKNLNLENLISTSWSLYLLSRKHLSHPRFPSRRSFGFARNIYSHLCKVGQFFFSAGTLPPKRMDYLKFMCVGEVYREKASRGPMAPRQVDSWVFQRLHLTLGVSLNDPFAGPFILLTFL